MKIKDVLIGEDFNNLHEYEEYNKKRNIKNNLKKQILEKYPTFFTDGDKLCLVAIPDKENRNKAKHYVSAFHITNGNFAYFINDCMFDTRYPSRQIMLQLSINVTDSRFLIDMVGTKAVCRPENADYPVVFVNAFISKYFCIRYGFKLPETQSWDYFTQEVVRTKDGNCFTYAGSQTIDDVAWYYENCGGHLHTVAEKRHMTAHMPLFDVSGNAYTWTNTRTDGEEAMPVMEMFADVDGRTREQNYREFLKFGREESKPSEDMDDAILIFSLETGEFTPFDYKIIEE